MTKEIQNRFVQLCEEYVSNKGALAIGYKNEKKYCTYSVELNVIRLEFCYCKKGSVLMPPSSLYCRLYLNKNSLVYHLLPDIFGELKIKEFRSCLFSHIDNPERMEKDFALLAEILERYLEKIEQAVINKEIDDTYLFNSYKQFYKLKETDLDFKLVGTDEINTSYFLYLQKHRDAYVVNRLTIAEPYRFWVIGNSQKSLETYRKWDKKNSLFAYEYMLVDFISSDEGAGFCPVSEYSYAQKVAGRDMGFFEMLGLWLVSFFFFSAIFCGVFAIANAVIAHNTVFSFAAPWYCGFVVAGLCGIFGGIAFRNPIRKLVFRKSSKQRVELDNISNSKTTNIFAYAAFAVFLAISIFVSVMMVSSYAVFYEKSFKYNTEEAFTYATYSYEEIENIYYISARYNDYGDRLERPSYVIVTKDKQIFDFDGSASVKETEEGVIPFLEKKGFDVIKLDSDRELEKILKQK